MTRNRRQISAKTREKLNDKIYDAYLGKCAKTFEKVFIEWLKAYKDEVEKDTYSRAKSDYNRFLVNTTFVKKPITKIGEPDIEKMIRDSILKFQLKKQGYKNLKSLMTNVFRYARKKKYMIANPIEFVEIEM